MKRMTRYAVMTAAVLALAAAQNADARTKLVTLPDRSEMIVNLERPGWTLLTEERDIALQQGTNYIDFSWQGVQIDQNSIRLEPVSNPGDGPDATKIISVAFPPNEAALTWQIFSPEARTERVRVTYLLNGISRDSSYEMTVNPEETKAVFQHYLRVQNVSGEDLEEAILRTRAGGDWTRTIESGETRRFLATEVNDLPVEKLFITRPALLGPRGEEGETISLVYEISNTADASLGEYLIPEGKTRIYAEDPDGSTIFTGEDFLGSTAVGEDARLTLGTVKDVVLKKFLEGDRRENERRNSNRRVVLYDRIIHLRYEVENFKDQPATLRIVENVSPDMVVRELRGEGVTMERKSGTELILTVDLEAGDPTGTADDEPKMVDLILRVPNVVN